jgi:C-terminal processing protease CtpA/Prc
VSVFGVGNPSFDHEPAYPAVKLPDAGYQLLSLFRFWNIIEYWSPNRDVMGVDWDSVLPGFIPRIGLAKSSDAYKLEMLALIATVNDTHANLWSSLAVRPPTGACQLPVHVRFIEDSAVVAGYTTDAQGTASGLKIGDVLTDLDGRRIADLVQSWRPYYAASNEPTRLRDIGRSLSRGACGDAVVGIRRGTQALTVRATRVPIPTALTEAVLPHDLPGETFRLLTDKVAYLKLSSVKSADVPRQMESASATQGLIIDIRNYPGDFVVFTLGQLLAAKPTDFARTTTGDLVTPGAFHWTRPIGLTPAKTHYAGKVVVLVDEVSVSNAEYTTMAFRAAGALVVGSTTAGADGNTSRVPLPGGLSTVISGIGVFYPDKKPTQRVGIVPDVEVRPTIAGVRAGRDEVLEEGLRRILGPGTPAAEIERIAREARAVAATVKPPTAPMP